MQLRDNLHAPTDRPLPGETGATSAVRSVATGRAGVRCVLGARQGRLVRESRREDEATVAGANIDKDIAWAGVGCAQKVQKQVQVEFAVPAEALFSPGGCGMLQPARSCAARYARIIACVDGNPRASRLGVVNSDVAQRPIVRSFKHCFHLLRKGRHHTVSNKRPHTAG